MTENSSGSRDRDPGSNRRLAVVTGASSGIGLELARELQRRGHDLVLCAEDAELAEAQRELAAAGGEARAVRADLATRSGVESLVSEVEGYGRPLEVLALNAGVGVGGPFLDTELDADLRLVQLNISAVVHLAKRLLPAMVQQGRGRVLVTSSIAALMPGPWYATYAASKAFGYWFAEALRHELQDTGVTVTALLPGPTDTEFFDRAGIQDTRAGTGPKDAPADVARDAVAAMLNGDHRVVSHSWLVKSQPLFKAAPEPLKAAIHAMLTERADGGGPPAPVRGDPAT